MLCERGVAVWDVLRECVREGSLDTAIELESEWPNDFARFFSKHCQIEAVFFNGQKAETAFRRYALRTIPKLGRNFRFLRLPSTSPAHAGKRFEDKLTAWQSVARASESKSIRAEEQ
jgi:double-stranded uracil-DNA glycosylase